MILNIDFFVRGENLLDFVTAIQILFFPDILQKTSAFWRCISHIKYIYFISTIKCINSRIYLINTMYSASVVLKVVFVCNFLHHSTGNPAYIITYPVRDMKLYMHYRHLLEPINHKSWHIYSTWWIFPYSDWKLRRVRLTVDLSLVNPHM